MVEIEGRQKLEISCNLPVADGMVIKTNTDAVKNARKSVLEFLLINHPLDCPICDRAGECLLQDYHFKYSGARSRFKEKKVKKSKMVDVGKYVKLDNERCILCTRCVRFCHEIARAPELCVAVRGDRSFITTAPGKRLDNPYSLNTADVCPVGALTSKDFRFKKRVWFLKSAPSICPSCSNGCPIWIDHAEGIMYRWRPRGGFLCNEGRLSYRQWQTPFKITKTLIRSGDGFSEIDQNSALTKISLAIKTADPKNVIGIISSQCSCEEIDTFLEFFKNNMVYKTGRSCEKPFEDNIIRKRDKNPNGKYLELKEVGDIPSNLEGDVLFILDSLAEDDILKIVNFKWKMIVQITHDRPLIVPFADIILPRAAFIETDGTFMNYNGERQEFSKAFEASGEAKSTEEWIKNFKLFVYS